MTGTRRRGFSLIEILVAVTILGIVSLTIFFVMQASVRSSRLAAREADVTQRVRFALDMIESDLRAVHYRDETTYNTYMTLLLKQYEQVKLEAEQSGDRSRLEAMYGNPNSRDEEENGEHVGSPYEKGELIDLSFEGKSGSDARLAFSRSVPLRYGTPPMPKGLARITYRLSGKALLRVEETVDVPGETLEGELLDKETPPLEEILAEGVESLDIAFSFWFDSAWYEVDSWDSSQRQLRSSKYYLAKDSDRDPTDPEAPQDLQPGDPGWNEFLNTNTGEPADALPSYVRLTLKVAAEPKKEKSGIRTYTRLVRMPTAQETYVLQAGRDPDEAEAESTARDDKYTPVSPGAGWIR